MTSAARGVTCRRRLAAVITASVLKCYILRGNYHASQQRLSIELELASGASRITKLTAELFCDVAELQRRLEGWRPEQIGKACHLFYAAHTKALARLTFKKLADATTGTVAVPAILKEVFDKHGGEVVKHKVMKLATLVRWRGGAIDGPPRQEMHRPGDGGALYEKWFTIAPEDDELRRIAESGKLTAPVASSSDGAAAGEGAACGDDGQ